MSHITKEEFEDGKWILGYTSDEEANADYDRLFGAQKGDSMLTKEYLDELRRICKEASQPPWRHEEIGRFMDASGLYGTDIPKLLREKAGTIEMITIAPEAIPKLIDEIERLKECESMLDNLGFPDYLLKDYSFKNWEIEIQDCGKAMISLEAKLKDAD